MIQETLKQLSVRVCQYFLDFLESDFKRQQAPRRRIILHNESGFRSGMSIAPYPGLQREIWKCLGQTWESVHLPVAPRLYTRSLSQPLALILKEQSAAISLDSIQTTILEVVAQAKKTLAKATEHPEEWVALTRQTSGRFGARAPHYHSTTRVARHGSLMRTLELREPISRPAILLVGRQRVLVILRRAAAQGCRINR
jgi:hypothetical protein